MRTKSLRGLYVITDPDLIPAERFEEVVRRALIGGARIVQYRDKGTDWGRRFHQAVALRDICVAHEAILIINDDVRLAEECGANGVHLGRSDVSVNQAREILGYDHIVGVSCYDSLPSARRAVDEGADYIAFGSFFPSLSKPSAARADLNLLTEAKEEFSIPVAAIGGITTDNAEILIRQGVDMIAVINAVFGPHDPERSARNLARLFRDDGSAAPNT